MGRASRRKHEQRTTKAHLPRGNADLDDRLREQCQLLAILGGIFDKGDVVAALPLATTIRVLLHDTSASPSLLSQLGIKSGLRYRDTAQHINPQNLLPNPGLVIIKMQMGSGSSWVAPLDNLSPGRTHPDSLFETWWTTPITKDANGNAWARREFVLYLANKGGGAHVDPVIPEDLWALEKDNSMGWQHSDPIVGEGVPMINGPILPSVRQIGHELQLSLEAGLGDRLSGG